MRNYLRDQARHPGAGGDLDPERRQALIAAAGWRGQVSLRTRRAGEHAVLEVQDNGIGMTEEVRRRCSETHFSTKRNNALFAGMSAGMGLGLSFVNVILESHQARLEIDSEALRGALFRFVFQLAKGACSVDRIEGRDGDMFLDTFAALPYLCNSSLRSELRVANPFCSNAASIFSFRSRLALCISNHCLASG